jgi:hypothetical protein
LLSARSSIEMTFVSRFRQDFLELPRFGLLGIREKVNGLQPFIVLDASAYMRTLKLLPSSREVKDDLVHFERVHLAILKVWLSQKRSQTLNGAQVSTAVT